MSDGEFREGNKWYTCKIIRRGRKNTRIEVDGDRRLVSSTDIRDCPVRSSQFLGERIVPQVPLERLYRRLRKQTGNKQAKYQSVKAAIFPDGIENDVEYVKTLFLRSVDCSRAYSNIEEDFHSDRQARTVINQEFAMSLVTALGDERDRTFGTNDENSIRMLDFEVFPFRTTKSFTEDGRPATRLGSGGLDLLLQSQVEGHVLPAVGEIKGAKEQVGPTFALIQSLMYASQLLTPNQFRRLSRVYGGAIAELNCENPRMDIVVLMQESPNLRPDDLKTAINLARGLIGNVDDLIRTIQFLWSDETGALRLCDECDC